LLDGSLLTRDFLTEGIRETEAWAALDQAALARTRAAFDALFAAFRKLKNPIEAETEKDLIWPLLEAIGWSDMSVQQNLSAKARDDVPDALLFAGAAAKAKAAPLSPLERHRHGACVVEAKRWNRVLDRADARGKGEEGVPSTQMLRYLRRVDDVTNGGLRWGMLTNGRHWRLYFKGALSVAEDFLEIDLGKVLDLPGCTADLLDKRPDSFFDDAAWRAHVFELFVLLFGRAAFVPDHRGETFLELALREGKQWEARVARDLSEVVFDQVFPTLGQALAVADGKASTGLDAAALGELSEGALILLYRLLFVLYAEDRNLLPDENGPYADYSLTRLRGEVADKKARGTPFSDRMKSYWSRLDGIFQAIAHGDDGLGIPPYNGGLFDPAAAPILARIELADTVVADILFRLSHIDKSDGRPPKYINYRDLSVQQLGSVYERILEHGLKVEDGRVVVAQDAAARKSSGSYYTSEELVALIIERAVGPLASERVGAFKTTAASLARSTRTQDARLAELLPLDPASLLLELKICDPAMGSGHFLVSLVDWLSDRVLEAMAEAAAAVTFADYVSPLAGRIESIRGRILAEAKAHHWPVAESQLDDRHIVRRMVLKRVVYGVDKNPMAVELAKVSLWLHSFTVGAPLSFLDHHLRCGDSIIGAWTRPTIDTLRARGALFSTATFTRVESAARLMESIEETTDSDIAEVAASKTAFGVVAEATQPIASFFSLLTAERMMGIFDEAPKRAPPALEKMAGKPERQLRVWREQTLAFEAASAFGLVLEGAFGDPVKIASGEVRIAPSLPSPASGGGLGWGVDERRRVLADRLVAEARERAARHRFFHWEIGFPNLWSHLLSAEPKGGFDAVIGNPPYVRQELLGDEMKRALKADYSAYDGMADLYVYFYEQGVRLLRPGGRLSYVVTNKWLKAGYAEALRELFATKGQVEFVADFGHAKHFFPDADVFPSVVVVRKPEVGAYAPRSHMVRDASLRAAPHHEGSLEPPHPEEARRAVSKDEGVPEHGRDGDVVQVCVIPRDAVPEKGLSAAVAAATYPLPRAHFTKESWTLEPPDVVALLGKIKQNGVPLADYAGVKPYRGVLTGLNEAFLIDTPTRDRLVKDDPSCAEIIKPYLRGQDIERWHAPWNGLWMIFARRGIEIDRYPSVKRHLEQFRRQLEPKPNDWKPAKPDEKWPGRKEGNYAWYEIQDSVDYWAEFDKPKIIYQVIQFFPSYALDFERRFGNDKTFIIPTANKAIVAALNAPIMWWFNWRFLTHLKDEALSPMGYMMERLPIAPLAHDVDGNVDSIIASVGAIREAATAMHDWLRHEFGLEKISRVLAAPEKLDADGFVTAVRAALPKSRKFSAAEIARLKQEHADTLVPARAAAAEILGLERKLSDLVNAAYGLTPDEVALMWRTAPPRMPLDPADELRRLGLAP